MLMVHTRVELRWRVFIARAGFKRCITSTMLRLPKPEQPTRRSFGLAFGIRSAMSCNAIVGGWSPYVDTRFCVCKHVSLLWSYNNSFKTNCCYCNNNIYEGRRVTCDRRFQHDIRYTDNVWYEWREIRWKNRFVIISYNL